MNKFIEELQENFTQWLLSGKCEEAVELNQRIGEEYFDESNPHFYTGNLKSEIVLIHLNPKRNKNQFNTKCNYKDFEKYCEVYNHFGKLQYGVDAKRTHKSPFDHKQVRFLRPFNLLPFKDGDKYHNLEVAIDHKLQLELIPFGSPNFSYKKVGEENMKPFIIRILELILSEKRQKILFCGRVFCEVLEPYIINKKTHSFKLMKNDGTPTRNDFELINVKIRFNSEIINAAIAPQYAKQGYPVERYGKKIAELYGEF